MRSGVVDYGCCSGLLLMLLWSWWIRSNSCYIFVVLVVGFGSCILVDLGSHSDGLL